MSLLERLKADDLTAFDEIYSTTNKNVYYTIYLIVKSRETAEDLMQETYLSFLDYAKKLKKDEEITPFLVSSAKNKAINYYNRHRMEQEYAQMLRTYSYDTDKWLDTGLLDKIKGILSEKECEVFLLHVLGEYSFKEISKITGIPIGTLTWSYSESRKKLLEVFGGE